MSTRAPLGLRRREVVLVPYDERWPELFEAAAAELLEAVGHSVLAIHHVGSTAVPELAAKPILDVLVSVPDFERAVALVPELEKLGYEFRPDEEVPDRHWFRRPRGGDIRTHHLSLAEPTSKHHVDTLAFRDALRGNQDLANAYSALKSELARRFPFDRGAYIEGKAEFVASVLHWEEIMTTDAQSVAASFHGVRYQVADVPRSVAFYTQYLGFKLEHQQPPAFANVSLGPLNVLLSGPGASGSRPMSDGRRQEPGGWSRIVLCVKDLPSCIDVLRKAGIHFRNQMEVGPGGKQVQIDDPDGNPIELFESAR